jgi:hypothetical protein
VAFSQGTSSPSIQICLCPADEVPICWSSLASGSLRETCYGRAG